MVIEQLVHREIRDPRVLGAMGLVPRHRFVDERLTAMAYEDRPLSIGHGQTISQPYMVARATELAEVHPTDRALEVGAGCGYQAAVLAELAAEVFAIEIIPELAARARRVLAEIGLGNVTLESFDGGGGWPAHAPYDVIIVSAGAPRVPPLLGSGAGRGRPPGHSAGRHRRADAGVGPPDRRRFYDSPMTRAADTSTSSAGSVSVAARRPPSARPRAAVRETRAVACAALLLLLGCHGTPPPMHPSTPPGRWYVVAPGETLDLIARRAGVPAEDILELNGFESAALVKPGTSLFVMTATAPRGDRQRRRPRPP